MLLEPDVIFITIALDMEYTMRLWPLFKDCKVTGCLKRTPADVRYAVRRGGR